jgi:hypothetical protein
MYWNFVAIDGVIKNQLNSNWVCYIRIFVYSNYNILIVMGKEASSLVFQNFPYLETALYLMSLDWISYKQQTLYHLDVIVCFMAHPQTCLTTKLKQNLCGGPQNSYGNVSKRYRQLSTTVCYYMYDNRLEALPNQMQSEGPHFQSTKAWKLWGKICKAYSLHIYQSIWRTSSVV